MLCSSMVVHEKIDIRRQSSMLMLLVATTVSSTSVTQPSRLRAA